MYQLLDSGFIGLIFSCYNEDASKVGRIQVIAFQSSDGKQNNMSRPIPLSPVNKSSIIHIDTSPSSSENVSTRYGYFKEDSPEKDTGDSRSTGASKITVQRRITEHDVAYRS
ncbi:Lys-63-specific deubiquitinase BRCC36, partial [Trifolium medium]|nr:Lys-63-specific deubiquitinase BRCC36 [Trifolium medium]